MSGPSQHRWTRLDPGAIRRERARRLASHRDDRDDNAGEVLDFLLFRVAGEQFALALDAVERVEPIRWWTPVPGAPPPIAGVINLQGEVLPLVELDTFLGMSRSRSDDEGFALALRGQRICLRVDAVDDFVRRRVDAVVSAGRVGRLLPDAFVLGHLPGGVTILDPRPIRGAIPGT